MKFIADFHIHSHYSLATSKTLTPEHLDYWAKLKGVDVLATGDCIHPGWLSELKEKLIPNERGFLTLKNDYKLQNINPYIFYPKHFQKKDTDFILTTEISNIYKKNGKTRKVHNLCIFPSFEAADKFQKKLDKIGNIRSDGRPILGLDSKILLELLLETDEKSFLIPAHIWTPWFSVLGSRSGFDSIEECYEDLTKYIFAVETGLSSDPPMNWLCSFLDRFRLVSNSDAHSPEKIGREANMFDCEKTYNGIFEALKNDNGFMGTIEFFPQEGKYHLDGHTKCNICFSPLETITHDGFCPVCNKPLVKGVLYRVYELADRPNINDCKAKKNFYSITSLPDLVSEITGSKSTTNKIVQKEYFNILENIGSDFHTLLFADLKKISKYSYILAESIYRMRQGIVKLKSGFDGEFGEIKVFEKGEIENLKNNSLFEEDIKNTKQNSYQKTNLELKKFKIEQENKKLLDNSNDSNNKNIYKYLNLTDVQKTIIEQKDGICIVIAGPGTGKTHVLTEKIAMLVLNGVKQNNILAITFSNKACEEIVNRLASKIINFDINVSTFHKLGLKIIKENISLLDRNENFCIISDDEKIEILNSIETFKNSENKVKFKTKFFLKNISLAKQGVLLNFNDDEEKQFFNQVFEEYQNILKNKNFFDLDDLIFFAVKILEENEEIKKIYIKNYKYILIDEYQDINSKQYDLIKNLLPAQKNNINLFVIGDPDQSIYGFRGSDKKFIQKLQEDFPNAKKIQLQKSFRCSNNILKLAGQVLHKNNFLEGKQDNGISTEIIECSNEKKEAEFIAKKIEEMMGGTRSLSMQKKVKNFEDKSFSFSDFAILCRTTKIYNEIINTLKFHSIPYQVIGDENFYKKEPYKSLLKTIKNIYIGEDINKESEFIKTMLKNKENINLILQKCIDVFLSEKEKVDLKIEDNLKKLLNIAEKYKNNYLKFFNDLSINTNIDDFCLKEEAVSIMTIHASKGLEFDTVFIPACEDGIIPFEIFGKKNKEELEEEERLLFVAITRTRKFLFISYAKQRFFENRLLKLEKSFILDRFEENLLKNIEFFEKVNNQIEFNF